MDSALKEAKPSAPAAAGRSKRSAIPVPIIVSGVDKDGQSFREDSRTLVITRRGMMIETIHPLRLGMEVTVENPAVGRKSTGRIVWCGNERSVGQPSEIGVYLSDAEGLCGIELAADDAQEAPASEAGRHEPEKPPARAGAQPGAAGPRGSELVALSPPLPISPPRQEPAEPVAVGTYEAAEATTQELDLTSELGQVETVPRGSEAPTLPELGALGERGKSLGSQAQAGLQASAASLEQKIAADLEHESPPVPDCPRDARVTVDGLSARLEEQQQQIQASLRQSAARLGEEFASRLEHRITSSLEQQLASVTDRLQGPRAEVDGWLGRLEEGRRQAQGSLQEVAARLEAESGARLEQRIMATLEPQLALAKERLQSTRTELEGVLGHVQEVRERVQESLQGSVAEAEEKVASSFQQHLAAVGERLQRGRLEAEGLHAQLEQFRQEAQSGLQESAARWEQESAARLEESMRTRLDQQVALVLDRLHDSRAEIEGSLIQLEEMQQQLRNSLQGCAAQLEQRVAASLEQQLAAAGDRLQRAHAELEGLLTKLEDSRQNVQQSLEQSATQLQEGMAAFVEMQLAPAEERLQGSRAEVEAMLTRVEEFRQQAEVKLRESAARLDEKTTVFLEHEAEVANRLRGVRAEAEGLLVKLGHLQQARETEIAQARTGLREMGSQAVQLALEGVNEKLEAEGERALCQFRGQSGEIVESACHALSQRVASAGDFIRDWSQQAEARLSSYSERMEAKAAASGESLQKQSEQIAAGFTERLESDASVGWSSALERIQQTAHLLEETTVASLEVRVQEGTQESVETAAAQLRQLAQENLDFVSAQFAEKQRQFASEMSNAMHETFNELVEVSSARLRQLTDDSLKLMTEQLNARQQLLMSDTTKAFRQKVGEILVMLQNGSGESS